MYHHKSLKSSSNKYYNKEYEHTKKVWGMFKIKNLGKYHCLHFENDVSFSGNVFETFSNPLIFNIT